MSISLKEKKKGLTHHDGAEGCPVHIKSKTYCHGAAYQVKRRKMYAKSNALPYGGANEVKKEEKCPVRSTGINLVVYYIILYYYGFFSLSSLLIGRNFSGRFNHFLLLILFKRSHNYFPLLHLSTIWHILKTDGGTICLVVSTRFF